MDDFKTIFNFFDSIINGMHRPHLYNESLMPELRITYPTFKGYIDDDGSIHVEGLEGLFLDGDKLHLEVEIDEENNTIPHITIKGICDDWRKDLIEIDIEPTFDDKTEFYEGLLEIAYSISCYRIEKHLLTPTTAEFKQSFSDSLILYVRNLIANLDKYEHSLKHDSDPANKWVIKSTRIYLLRLLAFICQKFDGYCRHKLLHQSQWERELYPGKAAALKKIISKFEPETKKETVKVPEEKEPVAFTGFGLKSNAAALLSSLTSLQLKIPKGLVNEAYSSIEDLHTILTATDISNGIKPVRFNCETTQLSYILRKIKDSFENLNDQTIEASGLFITASGKKLRATNIKKSLSDCKNKPKERKEIDTALAGFISKKQ